MKAPEGEPERWFLTKGRPIADENGALDRYFGVVIEITKRKLAEKAQQESELRMRLAQEAAKVGAWEWRLADNSFVRSDSLRNLYGWQRSAPWEQSIEGWRSVIYPENRERVIAAALEATARGQEFELQWRLNLPESEPERWMLSRGKPIDSANGRSDRYFGVVIEITEQKLAEEAFREGKERQSFLLSLNDALRAIDDPHETIAIASKMLGQKLNATQVIYAQTDETGEHATITHDWSDAVLGSPIYKRNDFDASLLRTQKWPNRHCRRRALRPALM